MTAAATITEARRILATLTDTPGDVLGEVLTADRALQVAGDLLIEARTVRRQDDHAGPNRGDLPLVHRG